MPRRVLSVIGGLGLDTIHMMAEFPEAGQGIYAEEFQELGGRAANIAIAAVRSCNPKPNTEDGYLPDTPLNDLTLQDYFDAPHEIATTPEVRIIAAVPPEYEAQFTTLLQRNGVNTQGLRVVEGKINKTFSWFQKDTKRARQVMTAGVERSWIPEYFDAPEKLGAGKIPDLVVVTMALPREVIEQIIATAHSARIDVIVYGSPAAGLLKASWPRVTHVILNEGDAGVIMGYDRGYVTIDKWEEVCKDFCEKMYVRNVVLKVGPHGAYYRNEDGGGYRSGYTKLDDVEDTTGSSAAFVGAYAVDYLLKRDTGTWQISDAVVFGNRVCAFCVKDIGCIDIPWADTLREFDAEPLYSDLGALRSDPTVR